MNEQQLRRLSDCEVMVSKYYDKLREYMAQFTNSSNQLISRDEFNKIWEDFNGRVSRDLGMIRKDILALKDENKKILDKTDLLKEEHGTQIQTHQKALNEQMFHVEQLQTFSENSNNMLGGQLHDIAVLKDKMANCEKISPDIEEFKRKMNFFIMNSQAEAKTLKKCLDDLFNLLAERKTSEDAMTSWVQQIEQKINDLPVALQNKIKSMKEDYNEKLLELSAKYQSKIDNLPKPAAPEPQAQPEDITPQLELYRKENITMYNQIYLDISNAKTKSDVNEMQLKIMDKKLENIYLLLKKHDLTQ